MDGTRSWDFGGEDDEYNTELIVHNFHPSLTKQGLRSQFLRFGYVESSNVTTNSRGHPVGFVRMRSAGECARAIAGLNGRAPLHWTVKMGLPPAERQRQRQRRDEARRFELETQPQTEACLREMEKVRQKMLQLTQEFCDTLEVGSEQQGQASEHTEQQHTPPTTGPGAAPTASHLAEQGLALCSVCGAVTAGYCSHCRQSYCSAACQRMDWEAHKPRCRPDLVVSVDSSSEEEQVRSVRLARGDQPASDRAPAPLRRPRATTGQARAAGRGSGDERTPVVTAPRQQVQQGSPQQRGRQLYQHQQQRSPLQQQSHPSPLHQQSPQQHQHQQQQQHSPQQIPQAQQQHSPQQIPQAQQQHSPQQIPQAQQQQQGQGQEPGAEERRRRLRQQQLLLLKRQKQRQQQQQREPQLGPVSLRPGQHYQVMVSYAADPSAVYLRLTDQYELVQRMEDELNKSVVSPATPAGFRGLETGQLCAALFEGRWYRGDVRTVEDSHYVIHFIDWGNSERVPPTGVTQLPASLQDVPPQAVLAVLPWRPAGPGGDWSDAQWEGLAALNGQPLTASVTGTEPSVRVALFNADGKSVLSVMADSVRTAGGPETQTQTQEWTVPPQVELEVDRKHVVVPCAMVHPQLVSAQVRDLALYRAYQAIVEQLQTAANAESPLSAVPPEGCPVLVNCPGPLGDGPAWRRAVVQGRHGDRAVVRLLDWGRLETAGLAQLRRLPPHLCETPSIGVQFGLFGVPESACPEDQLRFFREKLIGKEFLLERVESSDARTQARLHLLSDTNSFCFNDKMLGRVSDAVRVARPAAVSAVSAVSPPAVASPQKRCRLGSESNASRPPLLSDLANPSLRPGDTHPFLLGQVLGPGRLLGGPLTDENTAAVDRLEEELREAMTGQTAPLPIRQPPQAGQLVAVRGVEDAGAAGWARGAVVEPFGPQALVRLLDMGRQERVALDRLYQLPDQVSRLPPTSLLLAFRGSERWSAEQRQRAEEVLRGDGSGEEQVLDLTVVSVGSAGATVLVTCPQLEVC